MKLREVLSQPLLGKTVLVTESNNINLIGIAGEVVDETSYTFTVNDCIVPKQAVTISVCDHMIAGQDLLGTVTRIKRS